jgi:hypothetical protein
MREARLVEDLTQAMKARDMARVYVLRGVLAAIKNINVEKRGVALGEDEIVQVIRREIRKREEAEAFAVKAGRRELVEQNQAERAILEGYVPAQLDTAQLEDAIREIASQADGRSMGAIMGGLRARFGGRFDGRQASEIARRVLAEQSPAA